MLLLVISTSSSGHATTLTVLDPSVHSDTHETHAWLKLAMLQPLMLPGMEAHDCAAQGVVTLSDLFFIHCPWNCASVGALAVLHSQRCYLYCGIAQCVGVHSQCVGLHSQQ